MLNFILNLFSRKPELIPVREFTSEKNIFSLNFSDGWQLDNKSWGGIYDFYNLSFKGALQISGYENRNPKLEYDINKELEKTRKKYKAEIIKFKNSEAIMYNINYGDQQQYCWIIGAKNKMAFITYTTGETDSDKLDTEFSEIISQLDSFRIII